jgi:predicted metal-dependent enzyme (double-stranded beta helix superfamily)
MFDLERFIDDCLDAVRGPDAARRVLRLMREAVGDPAAVKRAVTPLDPKASVFDAPLYRSNELTVLNVTLQPGAASIVHDHRIWAVIGIYEGQENNTFYRRAGVGLETRNSRAVKAGTAALLGRNVVHAIENPLEVPTLGLHVYGGDLFAAERSMWNPASDQELAYDVPQFTQWSKDVARARRAAARAAAAS